MFGCALSSFLVYVSTLYIKASVFALWNTRGLNWPTSFEQHRKRTGELDLLDWLRAMFGFQACLLLPNRKG